MRCLGLARFEKTAFSQAHSPGVSQIQHRSHPAREWESILNLKPSLHSCKYRDSFTWWPSWM